MNDHIFDPSTPSGAPLSPNPAEPAFTQPPASPALEAGRARFPADRRRGRQLPFRYTGRRFVKRFPVRPPRSGGILSAASKAAGSRGNLCPAPADAGPGRASPSGEKSRVVRAFNRPCRSGGETDPQSKGTVDLSHLSRRGNGAGDVRILSGRRPCPVCTTQR